MNSYKLGRVLAQLAIYLGFAFGALLLIVGIFGNLFGMGSAVLVPMMIYAVAVGGLSALFGCVAMAVIDGSLALQAAQQNKSA